MFEIRIKTIDDISTPWETTPISARCEGADLDAVIDALMTDDVHEIRFNNAGSLQGHYIPHPRRCLVKA